MRHVVVVVAVLTLLCGCARLQELTAGVDDTTGYAAPGPDVVGTWRGTAFAVGGDLYHVSAAVELVINPDGTWQWSKGGQVQGRGRVATRGDRVILDEDWARKGTTQGTNAAEERIELKRRGDELWGVTRAFIPDSQNAITLKKAPS
jgi:hypothetical protein